jgi:murein DD-endopeptidase MepM/ murein hydrolase activator NlpD
MHNGVDLAAPTGTPVYAVAPGVVTTVGYTDINGNWIKVDHGEGYATAYLHLSRTDVARGAQVVAGQQLGAVGATGRVTGPHLHFILYKDGQEVDPLLHLGKIALVAGVTSTALVVAGTMAVGGIAIALAWAYTRKR